MMPGAQEDAGALAALRSAMTEARAEEDHEKEEEEDQEEEDEEEGDSDGDDVADLLEPVAPVKPAGTFSMHGSMKLSPKLGLSTMSMRVRARSSKGSTRSPSSNFRPSLESTEEGGSRRGARRLGRRGSAAEASNVKTSSSMIPSMVGGMVSRASATIKDASANLVGGMLSGSQPEWTSPRGPVPQKKFSYSDLSRIDQERREKLRDQESEDSSYKSDAQALLATPLETMDDAALLVALDKICFWCWLGGKSVQDVFSASGTLGSLAHVLRRRFDNDQTLGVDNQEDSKSKVRKELLANKRGALGRASMMRPVVEAPHHTDVSVASIKAVACLCRDHLSNQSRAMKIGLLVDVMKVCAHKAVPDLERKWGLHAVFTMVLSNAAGQDRVLESEEASASMRAFCAQHFHDSSWEKWPNNEARRLMHLLDWRP